MSPQPAAPPQNPPAADAPQTPGQRQIERAKALEAERAAVGAKIAANREYLRLMQTNDELTADEVAWLEVWYPSREKGERRSKDSVTATREAKKAARTA